MSDKKFFGGFVLFLFVAITKSGFCLSSKDSLLHLLQTELKNEDYDRQKEAKLQSIKTSFNRYSKPSYSQVYSYYDKMLEEYATYQFDSAHVYVQKMLDLSEKNRDIYKSAESKLKLLHILTIAGMFKEAFELVSGMDEATIPGELKTEYYNRKARLYESLANYDNDQYYAPRYRLEAEKLFKKMSSVSPPNEFEKTINLVEAGNSGPGRRPSAGFYQDFITHSNLSDHHIAMVAMRLSYHYSDDDKILFLALSAIHDIRSATKDTQAILKLGEELYNAGDLKMAYECIKKAISDAEFYNSRGHKIDIQDVLPLVAGKTIVETERERDQSILFSAVFAAIAAIMIGILFIVFVQLRKIKIGERLINEQNDQLGAINSKLMEHTRINEEYIGFFFKKSFYYISMLENLKRNVERKLKMKKIEEALDTMTALQISKERQYLYHTLDQIFLKLLPNFIPSFNALLNPEDQIWPARGGSLNTVLRIFALIRLGIKDDEAIARILDYSVSTIYTYRIRIKAKAIVRGEEFDRRLMSIEFIDFRDEIA